MIKKLRKKFILITMSLVSLVLIIVFSILCISNYRRLEFESIGSMLRIVSREAGSAPPKFEIGGPRESDHPASIIPVFCVYLDSDGSILSINDENVEVSQETAAKAVSLALASEKETGILSSLNLRYLKEPGESATKIAFADMTNEKQAMTSLILTSLLVAYGSLAAFFLISLFLANWALRPVERAWDQQRQFIADASHELKTPLTVILANTGILLSHKEDPIRAQVKWVEYTQTEAQRMKKMVDDLLFLAKSDASTSPVIPCQFNLSEAIWSCLLPFESMAFEQKVTLNSNIAPNVLFTGDEGQLKQLIVILLDNACKYAGQGGVVSFCMESFADKVRITVNNTGTPIAQEHLEHLFERFYRVDKARSREQGGYGLGLAIAKTITDKHHGKIGVESTLRNGTTFTVILPRK